MTASSATNGSSPTVPDPSSPATATASSSPKDEPSWETSTADEQITHSSSTEPSGTALPPSEPLSTKSSGTDASPVASQSEASTTSVETTVDEATKSDREPGLGSKTAVTGATTAVEPTKMLSTTVEAMSTKDKPGFASKTTLTGSEPTATEAEPSVSSSSGPTTPAATSPRDGQEASVYGDPHLKTWQGHVFDFHGECDLILTSSPDFDNGLGFNIHIRTKIRQDWSYVSDLALKIGSDILEVKSRGEYYINGSYNGPLSTVGGFPVFKKDHGKSRHKFLVDMADHGRVIIKVYNVFLAVSIEGAKATDFGDLYGLMGAFESGFLVGRDGETLIEDDVEFGQEWQVTPLEHKLFQHAEGPQYPQSCHMPEEKAMSSRRLDETVVSFDVADKACADWPEETREACIYDVMSTGDLEMAAAGAF